jgi:transcription elongation factor Elf1
MTKLTLEQKAAYLADPDHCPFCNSANIEGEAVDFSDGVSQDVSCVDCGHRWTDVLKVVEIKEVA